MCNIFINVISCDCNQRLSFWIWYIFIGRALSSQPTSYQVQHLNFWSCDFILHSFGNCFLPSCRDSGCLINLLLLQKFPLPHHPSFRGSCCLIIPLSGVLVASSSIFQGFWLHCTDVERCGKSRSSLLGNLHRLKTWYNNNALVIMCSKQDDTECFIFLITFSIARILWVSPNGEDGHWHLCLYALPRTHLFKVFHSSDAHFCWFTLISSLLEVAATETPGQSFGESMKATDKRMTAERWFRIFAPNYSTIQVCWALEPPLSRCAELSLVSIVNKLPESWICFRPVLPLMYASQYLPGISKFVFFSHRSSYPRGAKCTSSEFVCPSAHQPILSISSISSTNLVPVNHPMITLDHRPIRNF